MLGWPTTHCDWRKTGKLECKGVWQQLEMTVHVSGCLSPDWTEHCGVLSAYSSNYWYCCDGQMSPLGVLEESPLNMIPASVHDTQQQQHHAASPCQSSPCHLIHAYFLGRAWGGREGKGKERSAAIIQLQYLWKNSSSDALKLQRAATLGLGRLLSSTAVQCWAYCFILHSCSR